MNMASVLPGPVSESWALADSCVSDGRPEVSGAEVPVGASVSATDDSSEFGPGVWAVSGSAGA